MPHYIPEFFKYVASIEVTSVGSSYNSVPTITISAPDEVDGVQATATPIVVNGEVTTINITNGGSGYTSNPTVTITGGGGTGATATATINIAIGSLTDYTKRYKPRAKYSLPEFVRADHEKFTTFIEKYFEYMDSSGKPGNLLFNKHYFDIDDLEAIELNKRALELARDFPQVLEVDKKILYKHLKSLYEAKGSERAIKAYFKLVYNEDVEVTYPTNFLLRTNDGVWRKNRSIKVLSGYNNYDSINLNGRDIDIYYHNTSSYYFDAGNKRPNTTLTKIQARVETASKISYTDPRSYELKLNLSSAITEIPGPGEGATTTLTIDDGVVSVLSLTSGETDSTRTSGTYKNLSADSTSGSGTELDLTVVIATDLDRTAGVTINNGGKDFAVSDTITLNASNFGLSATTDIVLTVTSVNNGQIKSLVLDEAGSGYVAAPTVKIVQTPLITLTGTWTGTTTTTTITADNDGSATSEVSNGDYLEDSNGNYIGQVASVTDDDTIELAEASNFDFTDDTIVTVEGAAADIIANVAGGSILYFTINNGGTSYNPLNTTVTLDVSNVPTFVVLRNEDPTDTNAKAYLKRVITSISAGTYSGAELDTGFRVGQSYKITDSDSSYVASISVNVSGSGYTSTPTVTISGGGGTGATATAVLNNSGGISHIVITDKGAGYTSVPTVAISGGGGADATATATIKELGTYVRVKSVGTKNIPQTWDIIEPGEGWINESLTTSITSKTGEVISVDLTTGYLFEYAGKFIGTSGQLSEKNRLNDNRKYQIYSYIISSTISQGVWDYNFRKHMHPAGKEVFGDIVVTSSITPTVTYSVPDGLSVYKFITEDILTAIDVPFIEVYWVRNFPDDADDLTFATVIDAGIEISYGLNPSDSADAEEGTLDDYVAEDYWAGFYTGTGFVEKIIGKNISTATSATDILVPVLTWNRIFTDTAIISENVSIVNFKFVELSDTISNITEFLDFGFEYSDTAIAVDEINYFEFDKNNTDSVGSTESTSINIVKNRQDPTGFENTPEVLDTVGIVTTWFRDFVDNPTVSETVEIFKFIPADFTDSVAVTQNATLSLFKVLSDTVSTDDAASVEDENQVTVGKSLTDSLSVSETLISNVDKTLPANSATITDSGVITFAQDYIDPTYLATPDDYIQGTVQGTF